MYGGGSPDPVLELLSPEIVWHVPGTSPIAGDHQGKDAVAAYFQLRRTIAKASMRMTPGDAIATDDCVAQFVQGEATLAGEQVTWQTLGAYRFDGESIAEVWLVPLNLELFDRLWSA